VTTDTPREPADWLAAARAGSRDALGQLLETCRGYLLLIAAGACTPVLRPKAGLSDLVQETFLEAQRDFGQFRGQTADEFRGWVRRILLRNLANLRRRYQHSAKRQVGREVALAEDDASGQQTVVPVDDTPSPSDQVVAREQAEALHRVIGQLPEHYRQVLAWRHQEQLSFEEIGRRLDRTANAARLLWLRAVERVQQDLGWGP
jgi:RNA polymerase sigma-70 factor (ECF subfamily)